MRTQVENLEAAKQRAIAQAQEALSREGDLKQVVNTTKQQASSAEREAAAARDALQDRELKVRTLEDQVRCGAAGEARQGPWWHDAAAVGRGLYVRVVVQQHRVVVVVEGETACLGMWVCTCVSYSLALC